MQVKKQQLELDMGKQTDSRSEEYKKAKVMLSKYKSIKLCK